MSIMHPQYQEWIRYVFDHPVTEPHWHLAAEAPQFQTSQEDYAELIRETFSRSGEDLVSFSDAQVNQGIWFLASPTESDFIFSLRDGAVPTPKKVAGIRSIYDLYRDCFAKRCTETLGHSDEPGASDLNQICYMFWDVCPLSYFHEAADAQELEDAIFSVLEDTLRIPHRACTEAAVHGLGEIAYRYPARVKDVIDAYLKTAQLDAALQGYAERAREGLIQ
jgi:hypothetical protein